MKYNFDSEARLYMIFDMLGDIARTGPLLWCVDRERTEDVKNHVLDLILMIKILKQHLPSDLDYELINDYMICHDLPEVITGDITKFEGVSDSEIKEVTEEAINYLTEQFDGVLNFSKLFNGYENRVDIESKVVHMLDKIQSAIPFIKYQEEERVDIDNPNVMSELRNLPFIVKRLEEDSSLGVGDLFFEYHMMAVNITDEECGKYNVSRDDADLIVDVISSFAQSIYSRKKNGTLLNERKNFPIEAMKYNRSNKYNER